MLDRYMRLPYSYRSKIGHDTLIQNDILKELIKIKILTITDLDKKLKMKISRIKNLEIKQFHYIQMEVKTVSDCLNRIDDMIFKRKLKIWLKVI